MRWRVRKVPAKPADPQHPSPQAGVALAQSVAVRNDAGVSASSLQRGSPGAGELAVAFAVAFAGLGVGASSAHYWLDSGELAAAGFELGVMHPPGTPGLALLLRAAAWVPLGSLGFRMALLGCALGAVAVTLVGVVLARHGASIALRWGAAAWPLASLTFVRQCRVVEVYALGAALLMVTIWGLDPAIDRERRCGPRLVATFAAVWAAWCFGDLRLAVAPLVIAVWLVDARRGQPWARWAPPVVVMASAVIVALPLASVRDPWMDWGDPQTLGTLWAHLQAQSIREAFAPEILPASLPMWGMHASAAVSRLAEDLGAPGLVLATLALGLQAFPRAWAGRAPRRADKQVAIALVFIVAAECFYIVGVNPMGGADRQTGMVLAPIAALAVGRVVAGWLAGWLAGRRRVAVAVLPLAAAVALGPPLLHSLDDAAATRSWGAHAWTRGALAQLPGDTLLLSQSDDLAAGIAFAQLVEGARPDLVTAPAQHLHKAAPGRDDRRRAPWIAAAEATTERGRIEAALAGHDGPTAVEHAATTVMASVRFWSDRGAVPLAIAGSERVPLRPDVQAELQHWLPRLPTPTDRTRLATALSQRARGMVKVEGAVATGVAILRAVIDFVATDHASAWVTLAALLDRSGDTEGAIALTRRALALEAGRSVALTNLALYLSRDPSTVPEALRVAERAVALRPWRPEPWARLAQVRTVAGDANGAAQAQANAEQRSRAPAHTPGW